MIFRPKYSLNFNVTEYCIISIDSRESKAKHVNIISRLRAEADKVAMMLVEMRTGRTL